MDIKINPRDMERLASPVSGYGITDEGDVVIITREGPAATFTKIDARTFLEISAARMGRVDAPEVTWPPNDVTYYQVSFHRGEDSLDKLYTYWSYDQLWEGDEVEVPVGDRNRLQPATVRAIGRGSWEGSVKPIERVVERLARHFYRVSFNGGDLLYTYWSHDLFDLGDMVIVPVEYHTGHQAEVPAIIERFGTPHTHQLTDRRIKKISSLVGHHVQALSGPLRA